MNARDRITILVDIDDTINNLVSAWVKWLDDKYGLTVQPSDIDEWNIYKKFPTLAKSQVYEPIYLNEFWENVTPKADAVYYLSNLYEDGYNLYLCTNSNYETIRTKIGCLIDMYFPYMKDKIITISKKQMLKADFLIDDNPDNLLGGDYNKILFKCDHNKNISLEDKSKMYIVTDSWKTIYDSISDYASIDWIGDEI